jgi:hypothetical protein
LLSVIEGLAHVVNQDNAKLVCAALPATRPIFYQVLHEGSALTTRAITAINYLVRELIKYTGRRYDIDKLEAHCQIADFLITMLDGDLTSCPSISAALLLLPEPVLIRFEATQPQAILGAISTPEAGYEYIETAVKWGVARFKTAATAAAKGQCSNQSEYWCSASAYWFAEICQTRSDSVDADEEDWLTESAADLRRFGAQLTICGL